MLNHASEPHVILGRTAIAEGTAGTVATGGVGGPAATPAAAAEPPNDGGMVVGAAAAAGGASGVGGAAEAGRADGAGFTLTLLRPAPAGEQLFNTYDRGGTRPDVSWLLNYGFVPDDGAAAAPAAAAAAATALGTGSAAEVARYDAAIAALAACGPHTHGAVRLLERERAVLV